MVGRSFRAPRSRARTRLFRSAVGTTAALMLASFFFGTLPAGAVVRETDGATTTSKLPASLRQAQGDVSVIVQLKGQSLAEVYSDSKSGGRSMNAQGQSLFVSALRSQQVQVENSAKRFGAQVLGHYTNAYNGIWVTVDASKLSALAALPQVNAIVPTHMLTLENGPSVDYIKAPQFWATGSPSPFKGQGVKIGIIDSGIDYTHKLLGGSGNVADYTAAIGANGKATTPPPASLFPTAKVKGGYDFVGYDYGTNGNYIPKPDSNPMDDGDGGGHGSHVAGTAAGLEGTGVKDPFGREVYGVAPQADLYALKVFGHTGGVNSGVLMQAIEYALDPQGYGTGSINLANRLDVVNLSLGADFGQIIGSEVPAIDNAAKAGLIAVIAAGNASNVQYILGSPGTSSTAITAAAAVDNAQVVEQLVVNTPANLGPYDSNEGSDSKPLTTTPITGDVVRATDGVGTTDDACTAVTNGALFSGKIVLVQRGSCTFQAKVNHILGAGNSDTTTTPVNTNNVLAVIIYDNKVEAPLAPSVSAPVPVVFTTQAAGQAIVAALGNGTVNVSLSTSNPRTDSSVAGTLANFTSAGPGRGDATFKPDVAAPGYNIYSTKYGTGTGTLNESGTSMATPHVAGAVALLVQAHPDWTPVEIKAALMNTATPTHVSATNSNTNLFSLQGAGLIDVLAAGTAKTLAISKSNQGGIGFGFVEIAGKKSISTKVTVENKASTDKTYTLTSAFLNGGGAGVTLKFPATLKVKAGKSATFTVTITFDPATLAQNANRYVELDGRIILTSGTEVTNVPFQAIPIVNANVVVKGGKTNLTLTNKSAAAGSASFFTLGVTDPKDASSTYTGPGGPFKVPSGNASNDILAIGARTNDAYDAGGPSPEKAYEFAITTSKPVTNPVLSEFDTYISVNGDPLHPDFVAYTTDLQTLSGANYPTGTYVVVLRNLLTNTTVDIEYVNQNYNSNVLSFSIPVAAMGLSNYKTIQYQTFSYISFLENTAFGFTDETSVASFNPTTEAIVKNSTGTRVLDVSVPKDTTVSLTRSGTSPLLVVFPNNATTKNAEYKVVK